LPLFFDGEVKPYNKAIFKITKETNALNKLIINKSVLSKIYSFCQKKK